MRMKTVSRSVVAAACGVMVVSALAAPAAHADERFGDTDITGVVVGGGDPVVLGTAPRTVTVEVTATDPAGLQEIDATLYHGSFSAQDATVASEAACGPTGAATTTCTLTFSLVPGTAPADDAQAGTWNVSAYAIAADGDAVFLDTAASFDVRRETLLTADAAPGKVRRGRIVTVTGDVRHAGWAAGAPVAAAAGQEVELQFRREGRSAYRTVKTVTTAADGTVRAAVRAFQDGSYRWSYAGTAGTAAAVSAADSVDVRLR
ncbi:calcium-binding protein [Streptomyces pimonensis]|uniref:Calcium-binding protein n=1 Tax=Streptomyces pimonensis TaxID=2860288 RepID=A0ABV4ISJ3_9ACTN